MTSYGHKFPILQSASKTRALSFHLRAQLTGSNADTAYGACTKWGRDILLRFQCTNFLSVKDDDKEKDQGAIQADSMNRGVQKNRNRKIEPRTGRTEPFFRLTKPV